MKLPIGNQVLLLDNSMFDDGSVECRNFVFCTADAAYNAEWDLVQRCIPYPELILEAIARGKHHVNVKSIGLQYSGDLVLEIQWD